MNKKVKILLFVILLAVIVLLVFLLSDSKIQEKEFKNGDFKLNYDTTWKVQSKGKELELVHKRTKSVFKVKSKILDSNYIDTKLEDIIDDIIYSIDEQNKDYKLINRAIPEYSEYDSYLYLYEKDDEQVLVGIFKKDAKLVIAYYEASSKYYDIVLDSVDMMLKSIEIVFE